MSGYASRRGIRPDPAAGRQTNDIVPIIGTTSEFVEELGDSNAVQETLDFGCSTKTRQDFRSRITKMCTFFETEYPRYFDAGVRKVTDEDRADNSLYFYNNARYKYDLIYQGLNVDYVLAYLSKIKYKKR